MSTPDDPLTPALPGLEAQAQPGSPASDAAAAPGSRAGLGWLRFLKENLEAIAVAVVVALVIKHFCVEAFKIPTYSMEPTLLGENKNGIESEGDRILVDKWAFLFSDPERWDVIVFRYPLNQARHFIKRIVGLPGERLRISADGDAWVGPAEESAGPLRPATKPRRVREQLYTPVYPHPSLLLGPPQVAADYWVAADDDPPNSWRLESPARFSFRGGPKAGLQNARKIRNHDKGYRGYQSPYRWEDNGDDLVRDLRVRARIALPPDSDSATQVALLWRPDGDYLAAMVLSSDPSQSRAFIRRKEIVIAERNLGRGLIAGASIEAELEYVDGELRAHLDGSEVAVLADGRTFDETSPFAHGEESQFLRLEAAGGPAEVLDVHIDRDLQYTQEWSVGHPGERQGVRIPARSYFMLGDNSAKSADSRKWTMAYIRLNDGRVIAHDREPGHDETSRVRYETPDAGGRTRGSVTDADGVQQTWYRDEEVGGGRDHEPYPFVVRDLIVGRAFLVFWPWTPTFPGRMGFIH